MQSVVRQLWAWLRDPAHSLGLGISLVPPYLLILFMQDQVRAVPRVDQWTASLPQAIAVREGTWGLDDLLVVYNGHRHTFNHISTAFLTATTGWDVRLEAWLSLPIAVITWLAWTAVFAKQRPDRVSVAMPAFAVLVFSLFQDENWLNPQFATNLHPIFFFSLALVVISYARVGWGALLAVMGFAFCASLAFGTGFTLWLLLPFVMFWHGYRKPAFFAAWVGVAAAAIAFHLVGYFSPEARSTDVSGAWSEPTLSDPIQSLEFALNYLGVAVVPLEAGIVASSGVGLVGLLSAVLLAGERWRFPSARRETIVWVALVGFAVGSAILTAIGRSEVSAAGTSEFRRFVSAANLLWIGWIGLLLTRPQQIGGLQMMQQVIGAGVLILLSVNRV
jgi:hypothetical protein